MFYWKGTPQTQINRNNTFESTVIPFFEINLYKNIHFCIIASINNTLTFYGERTDEIYKFRLKLHHDRGLLEKLQSTRIGILPSSIHSLPIHCRLNFSGAFPFYHKSDLLQTLQILIERSAFVGGNGEFANLYKISCQQLRCKTAQAILCDVLVQLFYLHV